MILKADINFNFDSVGCYGVPDIATGIVVDQGISTLVIYNTETLPLVASTDPYTL